jgi:hypothetical protein
LVIFKTKEHFHLENIEQKPESQLAHFQSELFCKIDISFKNTNYQLIKTDINIIKKYQLTHKNIRLTLQGIKKHKNQN